MIESSTPGARRALDRAAARARRRGAALIEPVDLLAALADEPESRAGSILAEHGLDPAAVAPALGLEVETPPDSVAEADEDRAEAPPRSPTLRAALGDAGLRAREFERGRPIGTEHLLLGLLATEGPAGDLLRGAGIGPDLILDVVDAPETGPIAMEADLPAPVLVDPAEAPDLARILDASANRAREGLRVVEDFARFALDDSGLTRRLKEVRHRLADALRGLGPDLLLAGRDTRGDVGTHIMTASEGVRESPRAVLTANFKRTAEALRSLEEYAKLLDPWLAGRFEVLRYDVYTLEKLTLTAAASRRALGHARLYVLVGGLPTLGDLTWVVGEALAGGAQVIQLREKGLPDRIVLERARVLRTLTARAEARLILNDRADLARICGADGVHLGQDDLLARDARGIVGPNALIGRSTHDAAQLDAAILEGASYLGVGPVFPGTTKGFDAYAGLAFVRQAAEATALPWFAIGGITLENVGEVLDAGARRIAVGAAVTQADRPRAAAAALRARLDGEGS